MHLILYCCLFYALYEALEESYNLMDTSYETPKCTLKNGSIVMNNHLGHLILRNNLLGNALSLNLLFDNDLYACALCEVADYYCMKPLPADAIRVNAPHLNVTTANLFIVALDRRGTLFGYSKVLLEMDTMATQTTRDLSLLLSSMMPLYGDQCQSQLQLIMALNLTITRNNQTLYVMASPTPAINEMTSSNGILCNSSLLYERIGFNCTRMPWLATITYTMNNCLLTEDKAGLTPVVIPTSNATPHHSPLGWYHACLLSGENGTILSNETLCGESLCTLLYQSNLYLSECDTNSSTSSASRVMTPWYEMAVALITTTLNMRREQRQTVIVWLYGREILERHCDAKEAELNPGITAWAIFSQVRRQLTRLNLASSPASNHTMVCGAIRAYFDTQYNATMGKMLFNQWYYRAFKFALLPGRDMEMHSLFLISFLCSVPFVLAVLLLCGWHKLKHRREVPFMVVL